MEVNRAEALRYLGYKRGQAPDERTESVLNACIPALQAAATFHSAHIRVSARAEGETVLLGPLKLMSRALARHMEGCEEAYLFAATLGAGVDRLMQTYTKADLPAAVVLQACAAALLESCCDEAQANLESALGPGLMLRPRFSPGYGDLSLDCQPDILRVLDAPKKIGLSCTQTNMLTPTKSITAVMGIKPGKRRAAKHDCSACGMERCAYKKE
ncbi:MAG TPA: Vitamin B12 dependent methionine synthase activation subunit [Feifaniaceae bacterium]|nr:Vitamin B12 dependent methionine synthase activation subunit [Feifaniaceae bacterium]